MKTAHGTGLLDEPAVSGVALLTASGTPLVLHGELDGGAAGPGVDWPGFAAAAGVILRHAAEDPEAAAPLAAHTEGLSLGALRFALLRVGLADIDATGTAESDFVLKLAALPWRLLVVVLGDKRDAARLREVTDELADRIRA